MSRYIDADAIRYHDMSDGQGMWYVWRDEIHDMPTADVVELKRGKWLEYKCSICGFEPYNPSGLETFNYCSNCGAEMKND